MRIIIPCDGNSCRNATSMDVEDIDHTVEHIVGEGLKKTWGEYDGNYYCGRCWPIVKEENNIPEED